MDESFEVRLADWAREQSALRAVREAVFVQEQSVPHNLEWDGLDPGCVHVLAHTARGEAIGTGRLLPDGHIGRMCVRAPWRRRGVASAMLALLMEQAWRAGHSVLRLHAQSYVVAFYERYGFRVEGEEFIEAGIPHRAMVHARNPSTA